MVAPSARVLAFAVPTPARESDGTLSWDETVLVAIEITVDGTTGFGYTYADVATAELIHRLAKIALVADPMAVGASFREMGVAVRNMGRQGIAAMAISAVDIALWDLKAKRLRLPLVDLLGALRSEAPAYGSGGFTSYSVAQLQEQLRGWKDQGLQRVKMKIGREADVLGRVRAAREAVGPDVELFVDANGAYERKHALALADAMAALGVVWFEEPVSSDDLDGLRFIRDRGPAAMDVAAGEYGWESRYFARVLDAGAVDVLQADATRCGGITGFMRVGDLCDAHGIRLSAHCAPSVHTHVACAAPKLAHVEYFADHERIEHMLLDGAVTPRAGCLVPDRSKPGLGLALDRRKAEKYEVYDAQLRVGEDLR